MPQLSNERFWFFMVKNLDSLDEILGEIRAIADNYRSGTEQQQKKLVDAIISGDHILPSVLQCADKDVDHPAILSGLIVLSQKYPKLRCSIEDFLQENGDLAGLAVENANAAVILIGSAPTEPDRFNVAIWLLQYPESHGVAVRALALFLKTHGVLY